MCLTLCHTPLLRNNSVPSFKITFSQGVHEMPYIFVAASIISVLLVVILFKITIEKIKEDPQAAGHAQTRFFIGVAISEIIPIILIAYGMMNIEQVSDITELYVPGLIIILTVAIALFFVILQKAVSGGDEKAQQAARLFTTISLPLISSIPIVSIVGLLMMMP